MRNIICMANKPRLRLVLPDPSARVNQTDVEQRMIRKR
jgi:hypothetical protein